MIFQKKFLLSDEEYIERIRKSDRNFRRMRWVWLMLLSAMFGVLAWFSHSVQKISTNLPEEKSLFSAGMAPGIIFGFLFVMIAARAGMALKPWVDSRSGFRTERLLLHYFDKPRREVERR